jgi:hypothetical protein
MGMMNAILDVGRKIYEICEDYHDIVIFLLGVLTGLWMALISIFAGRI